MSNDRLWLEIEVESAGQAGVLWILLIINFAMFIAEFAAGLVGGSAALIADSLDMLADAAVYGVSLYAVARAARSKAMAAMLSGCLQVGLGILAIFEIGRRALGSPEPEPGYMIAVSSLALVAKHTVHDDDLEKVRPMTIESGDGRKWIEVAEVLVMKDVCGRVRQTVASGSENRGPHPVATCWRAGCVACCGGCSREPSIVRT